MKYILPAAAIAFLSAQPLMSQQLESIETFGGSWDTNWGEVWVMPTNYGYEGTYTNDNGVFWLEFTDHVFEGYWAEDFSDRRCETQVMGSYYWGRLELGNSQRYPGFQMFWGYCDTGRLDKIWTFQERLPDGL